jgi:pimeloyl-ACP methyl ester carboxylesterase
VDRAVWIGHSLGAQVVTRIAARWPDRARAVVLVGPTGDHRRLLLARQAAGLAREAGRTSARVIRAVARDYLSASPARYIGTWIRHARDDMTARLGDVRCPALVVVGTDDPICRPAFVQRLRRGLPDARVHWVPGGTHALPRGHADTFNRIVTGFILDVARPDPP